MINIYSLVEDLECTEYYDYSQELKERLRDTVGGFIEEKNIDEDNYMFVSDSHLIFEENEEEYEDELRERLECVYEDLMEELEEDED